MLDELWHVKLPAFEFDFGESLASGEKEGERSDSPWTSCAVSDLKAELKRRNLPVSGSKPQLIERLKPFSDFGFVALGSGLADQSPASVERTDASEGSPQSPSLSADLHDG